MSSTPTAMKTPSAVLPTPTTPAGTEDVTKGPASSISPAPTPTPTSCQHNTRLKNKDVHPGQAHKAYDQTRRSSAVVAAERAEVARKNEEAEKQRLGARDRLAAYEDRAQTEIQELTQNFLAPGKLTSKSIGGDKNTKAAKKKDLRQKAKAELEALRKRISELEQQNSSGSDIEVTSVREDQSEEETHENQNDSDNDAAEKPQPVDVVADADDDVMVVDSVEGQPKAQGKKTPRTTRAEINKARTLPPSSAAPVVPPPTVDVASLPSPAASNAKKRKTSDI
ncbi:hypothetical protein VNI00_011963 [Paramarasmius palmivorus]|uniref:Uncharacterized protein n=1 Tax=Paramarasmius palmivorus TaxID=297713 RepID=A0AAW0C986_9AGAR